MHFLQSLLFALIFAPKCWSFDMKPDGSVSTIKIFPLMHGRRNHRMSLKSLSVHRKMLDYAPQSIKQKLHDGESSNVRKSTTLQKRRHNSDGTITFHNPLGISRKKIYTWRGVPLNRLTENELRSLVKKYSKDNNKISSFREKLNDELKRVVSHKGEGIFDFLSGPLPTVRNKLMHNTSKILFANINTYPGAQRIVQPLTSDHLPQVIENRGISQQKCIRVGNESSNCPDDSPEEHLDESLQSSNSIPKFVQTSKPNDKQVSNWKKHVLKSSPRLMKRKLRLHVMAVRLRKIRMRYENLKKEYLKAFNAVRRITSKSDKNLDSANWDDIHRAVNVTKLPQMKKILINLAREMMNIALIYKKEMQTEKVSDEKNRGQFAMTPSIQDSSSVANDDASNNDTGVTNTNETSTHVIVHGSRTKILNAFKKSNKQKISSNDEVENHLNDNENNFFSTPPLNLMDNHLENLLSTTNNRTAVHKKWIPHKSKIQKNLFAYNTAKATKKDDICEFVNCDFEDGTLCNYVSTEDKMDPEVDKFASHRSGVNKTRKSWQNWQGRYKNRVTGITGSRYFSNRNKHFAATYVRPYQWATLSTVIPEEYKNRIEFWAWEATRDVTLRVCCNDREHCPVETELRTNENSRSWRAFKLTCPFGTKKLIFACENLGSNQGACGVDRIILINDICQKLHTPGFSTITDNNEGFRR